MSYLYETHLHTCRGSACGVSTGAEHVRFYKEMGYTGIIVTEHFYGGNTCVNRHLPWEEFVDGIWNGYEEAKAEGDKIGLDVFFGYEQNYDLDEYLVYGLSKDYMKAHPEMIRWTRKEQLENVHAAGGCVVQAHPFRIAYYMDKIRLAPGYCDAVEAANAGNEPIDDYRCFHYAMDYNFLMTAGSDNHKSPTAGMPFGVELEQRLTDIKDYARLIRSKGKIGLHIPEARFLPTDFVPDERHIAYMLNKSEELELSKQQWFPEREE